MLLHLNLSSEFEVSLLLDVVGNFFSQVAALLLLSPLLIDIILFQCYNQTVIQYVKTQRVLVIEAVRTKCGTLD